MNVALGVALGVLMSAAPDLPSANDLLEALPVAVYTTDAEGRLTFYNRAAADFWGYDPPVGSKWCGSWRLYHTDGRSMPHDECPMALTLKNGHPVRGVQAVAERPDGTRVPFQSYPTALKDKDGNITGGINLLVDLSDQQRLLADSTRMAAIVSSSDDAIISKTLEGIVTSWNASAERIFGYLAEEMIGQSIMKIIPADLHDEEKQIIGRLARGERVDHYETVRLAKDGRLVDISLTVSPLRDASGRVVGASKVARDVSERKRAEEVQQLLLNELNHRIKNTLATVQAIASQTLRRAPSPAEFVTSFSGRIQALARAHMMLTGSTFQKAEISQLVRDQLLLGGPDDPRISCSGPTMMLEADAALHLALALHELGTNARKYGALSSPDGSIAIRWEMHANGGRELRLDWVERGGPPVRAPSTRGFGTVLIERSLQSHGGQALMRYAEDGVTCAITLPLSALSTPVTKPARGSNEPAHAGDTGLLGLAGKRILIVEDEPLIAREISDFLSDAGCEVVGPALSFDEAQRLIGEGAFDAALLDGNLGGRPVDDLAIALTRAGAPFVFVTGYGREALPIGFREGPIIEKPFTRQQLTAALQPLWNRDARIAALRGRSIPH